jgi:hypothetical protein
LRNAIKEPLRIGLIGGLAVWIGGGQSVADIGDVELAIG